MEPFSDGKRSRLAVQDPNNEVIHSGFFRQEGSMRVPQCGAALADRQHLWEPVKAGVFSVYPPRLSLEVVDECAV